MWAFDRGRLSPTIHRTVRAASLAPAIFPTKAQARRVPGRRRPRWEETMEEFATEHGNGERGLRVQSGVPVDFQAFQEIEIGLVGLLAESLSNSFAAARRIFGEGTRTAAGMLSDVIKA